MTGRTTPDIRARHALITDRPQRIPEPDPAEFEDEILSIRKRVNDVAEISGAPDMPGAFSTVLRNPVLAGLHFDLGIHLMGGLLSPRERELAVLRTGWLCQAPYEWCEHVDFAKRAGLSEAEIERITQGSTAPGWDERDRAILRAVEELHSDAFISDETWAALAGWLDEKRLLELVMLIGQYHTVAYLQNSLRIQLVPGRAGLAER